MQIPEKLKDRLSKLGLDESVYNQRTRKCILSREKLDLEKVPWFDGAYFIDDNLSSKTARSSKAASYGSDYFVFDPVSLIPCIALEPKKADKILDMCAAPGTKTFILSFMTENEAEITANDIDIYRIRRLKSIVNRNNLSVSVTNLSGRKLKGSFNKILLDAPCSGEGMVNKKEKLFEHWSEKSVKIFSKKQKKLLEHAFEVLEPGGTLVYSTCTFGPEENEEVVDFLLEKFDNAVVDDTDIKNIVYDRGIIGWDGKEFNKNVKNCIRIYPQRNSTGGFFVAKIRKPDE